MAKGTKTKRPSTEERNDHQRHDDVGVQLVTPTTSTSRRESQVDENAISQPSAKRTLFPSASISDAASLVTPQPTKRKIPFSSDSKPGPPVKRRLMFGKVVELTAIQPNVEQVYKIIKNLTGSIGGNGHVGPIYGELTMGSMQKMINLMVEHCDLDSKSRFIDVGSGIGKPNLHVAQYPGVAFSCGVEVEESRWVLGVTCLKAVLDVAVQHSHDSCMTNDEIKVLGNTVFLHKDIIEAKNFDPFTHVYMFSIGFPPPLWLKLSDIWNNSHARYLICYHGPKDIIQHYDFDAELIAQMPTSMHGSKEGHMGYIYRRTVAEKTANTDACDPMFAPSWNLVKSGLQDLHEYVSEQISAVMGSGRKTRSKN
jgi:Histone methylation protein DOT1